MANKNVLPPEIVEKVAQIPESGMGYHVVDARLRNGSIVQNVVILSGIELAPNQRTRELAGWDIVDVIPSRG